MRLACLILILFAPSLAAQTASVTLLQLTLTPIDETFRSFAGEPQVMPADADSNALIVNPPPTFASREVRVEARFSYSFDFSSNGAIFSCGFVASPFPDSPGTAIVERIDEGADAGSGTTTVAGSMLLTEGLDIRYTFSCGLGTAVGRAHIAEDTVNVRQVYQPIDTLKILTVDPPASQPLTPGAEQTFTATVAYTRDVIRLGSQAMLVATDRTGRELVERNERHQNNSSRSANGDGPNEQTIELTLSGVTVPEDGFVALHAEQITLNSFGEFASAAYTTYNESPPVIYGEEATTDYSIWHIEVNQAVQNDDNLIPLVAGKPGVVRVFVRTPELPPDRGDNPTIVPLTVKLRKDGQELVYERRALALLSASGAAPAAVRHTHLGVEIPLPRAMLAPGTLEVQATANLEAGEPFLPEADPSNNTRTETFELFRRDVLTVAYVAPWSLGRPASADLIGTLFPLSPTDGLEYVPAGRYEGDDFERDFNAPQVILNAALSVAMGEYDLLVVWSSLGQANPLFEQLAYAQTNGRVAYNVYSRGRDSDRARLAASVAQTLLGSSRQEACRAAADADFQTALGWDSMRSRIVDLERHRDLLLTCAADPDLWISPSRYSRLFLRDFSPFPAALSPEDNRQTADNVLLVAGEVTRQGAATIAPVVRTASRHAPELDATGSHCVVAGGPAGSFRHCFTPDFSAVDTVPFVVALPGIELNTLSVQRNGESIASVEPSASAPTISFTAPTSGMTFDAAEPLTVAWTTSDADGDPVSVSLLASGDGGMTFRAIAANISADSYVVDIASIPGGEQVVFRAIASDGLLSASADVGPLTVNQEPAISVADEIDFGAAAAGVARAFSIPIEALGSGPLEILSMTSDSPVFSQASSLPLTLLPGSAGALIVEAVPPTPGEHTATLTLETNAGAATAIQVRIQGLSAEQPILDVITPNQGIDFPTVSADSSAEATLSLVNRGGQGLTYGVTVEGAGFATDQGAGSLGPGERQDVTIRFAPSAAGDFAGTARIVSDALGVAETTVALSGVGVPAPTGPRISQGGIVNAASFAPSLTRGAIASLFGVNLAEDLAAATDAPLPTELGGVQVLVDGTPAPLFFVSGAQVNFQIPFEAALDGSAVISVRTGAGDSPQASVQLSGYAPGVFTNPRTSEPIVTRTDGSLIDAASPAVPGDVLIVYLTGIGDLTAMPSTGELSGAEPLAVASDTPTVTASDATVQVYFAGLTPGFAGLAQINIQLPADLSGEGPTIPLIFRFPGGGMTTVDLPFDRM